MTNPTQPVHDMRVLSSYRPDGTKMVGVFGQGDPDSAWRLVADLDLTGPEPAWARLQALYPEGE